MKVRRHFDIEIFKLSNKKHDYEFEMDSSFFAEFEDSIINKGLLKAKLTLDKSDLMIQAYFVIEGSVELVCDRSMENFDFHLKATNKLIFKYAEEYKELTDEIITIPKDTQKLNVSQYIYEFIGLAVQIRKIHPKFITEDDDPNEEGTLIYSTEKEVEKDDKEEKTGNEEVDPRWNILKKLKNSNN